MRRIYVVAITLAMLVAMPGLASADPSNQKYVDYVISRALSQRGVPFAYGGGDASGPTASKVPAPTATAEAEADVFPSVGDVSRAGGAQLGTAQLGYAQLGNAQAATPSAATVAPSGVVRFDASGLIQYAFAGVGLKLPRSSGEQYKFAQKVPPAQALPGDLIFYGPEGSQSVAMFLGNGQMLEATEPAVKVSPVRTNGMAPYVGRMINWQ